MRAFLWGVLATLVVIVAGIVAFAELGFVNFRADIQPSEAESKFAMSAVDASTDRHAPETKNPLEPTEETVHAGAVLYRDNCSGCHGDPANPEANAGKQILSAGAAILSRAAYGHDGGQPNFLHCPARHPLDWNARTGRRSQRHAGMADCCVFEPHASVACVGTAGVQEICASREMKFGGTRSGIAEGDPGRSLAEYTALPPVRRAPLGTTSVQLRARFQERTCKFRDDALQKNDWGSIARYGHLTAVQCPSAADTHTCIRRLPESVQVRCLRPRQAWCAARRVRR